MSAEDTNIVLLYDYEPLCARLSSSWWKRLKRARQSPARRIYLRLQQRYYYIRSFNTFTLVGISFRFFSSCQSPATSSLDVLCNGSLFDEVVLFPIKEFDTEFQISTDTSVYFRTRH